MFGLLKKKKNDETKNSELVLVAPVNGKTIPLADVPDPVFSEKLAGEGIAIEPSDNLIVSPADGELSLVFKTKHAFALTLPNGIELLVHIGLETVGLNGEGFEQLVEAGTTVKAGTPIIKIDREFIKSKGCELITPILITNPDITTSITPIENIDVSAGKTAIVKYTV